MGYKMKGGLLKVLLIAGCLFVLSACKSQVVAPEATSAPSDVPSDSAPSDMKRILVLPFENVTRLYGENVSVRCALCGRVFISERIPDAATDILTEKLISLIQSRAGFEIIPADMAQGVRSSLMSGKKIEMPEKDIIVETGRDLGADAVVAGHLYRFKERVGTGFSVESPASVAFHIDLVRVADGHVVWSGNFDETQQSLFEDLFTLSKFLKRKGRWITAKELAISGLENVFKTFPEP